MSPPFGFPTTDVRFGPMASPVRPRPPKVLLCDLDGTLVDTMPTLADLAAEVLDEVYALPRILGRELYLATCGAPFVEQIEIICPGDARNAHAVERFETQKPPRCQHVNMTAGTARALSDLQRRGTRVVVSSNNGTENVDAFVTKAGFRFDLALGFGNGLAKGASHIALCERTFGISRREMLFVGDSLRDGAIAEECNLPFMAVAGTFSKERFSLRFPGVTVLQKLSDLTALFADAQSISSPAVPARQANG